MVRLDAKLDSKDSRTDRWRDIALEACKQCGNNWLPEVHPPQKFSEFLGNIAPPDKKAMWNGFTQAPMLIGWTIEGKLGPQLYHIFSAKDEFARQMLVERGLTPEQCAEQALPIGEAFKKLVQVTGDSPEHLTRALYQSHHVGLTWYVFAAIGVASAVMIYAYGQWILRLAKKQPTPRRIESD